MSFISEMSSIVICFKTLLQSKKGSLVFSFYVKYITI